MASITGLVEIECDYLNGIDSTTISYLDATSSIQTQFDNLTGGNLPNLLTDAKNEITTAKNDAKNEITTAKDNALDAVHGA